MKKKHCATCDKKRVLNQFMECKECVLLESKEQATDAIYNLECEISGLQAKVRGLNKRLSKARKPSEFDSIEEETASILNSIEGWFEGWYYGS